MLPFETIGTLIRLSRWSMTLEVHGGDHRSQSRVSQELNIEEVNNTNLTLLMSNGCCLVHWYFNANQHQIIFWGYSWVQSDHFNALATVFTPWWLDMLPHWEYWSPCILKHCCYDLLRIQEVWCVLHSWLFIRGSVFQSIMVCYDIHSVLL